MNRSDSIADLAAALAKAQGQIKGAIRDSDNPFFKSRYADLAAVWEACREALSTNGLAVVQTPAAADPGWVAVETMLAHESGQWVSDSFALPVAKADAQGYGSAITYARRYALASIVGVAPEDDDAESAVGRGAPASHPGRKEPPAPPPPAIRPDGKADIYRRQVWASLHELVKMGQLDKDILVSTKKSVQRDGLFKEALGVEALPPQMGETEWLTIANYFNGLVSKIVPLRPGGDL